MTNERQAISTISLNALELPVHLGWTESERSVCQPVFIDITIHYFKPPKACVTDELADTVCYDELITTLSNTLAKQTFKLLEALTYHIYHVVKKAIVEDAAVNIRVTKKPVIPGLTGGATFYYSEI